MQRTSQGNTKSPPRMYTICLVALATGWWILEIAMYQGWARKQFPLKNPYLPKRAVRPRAPGSAPSPSLARPIIHTLWRPGFRGALVVKPQFQPVPAAPSPRPQGLGCRGATAFLRTTSSPIPGLRGPLRHLWVRPGGSNRPHPPKEGRVARQVEK